MRSAFFDAVMTANDNADSTYSATWSRDLGTVHAGTGDERHVLAVVGICDGIAHLRENVDRDHPELCDALASAGWELRSERDLIEQRVWGPKELT